MGLLRTAAKASVATRVVGNVHRRQSQRWAAEDATAAVPPAAPAAQAAPATPAASAPSAPAASAGAPSMLDQLTQLGQLRDAGVLTSEEFETQKARVLAAG